MPPIVVKVVKPARRSNFVLRWIDAETGTPREKSAGTGNRREADRIAGELVAQLSAGSYEHPNYVTWEYFCQKYEGEYLPGLARRSRDQWGTTRNHLDNLMNPHRLADLTTEKIQAWVAKLRSLGMSENSIASYVRTLRAALGWAKELRLIRRLPNMKPPRRARRSSKAPAAKHMRSRPVSDEGFMAMLNAIHVTVGKENEPAWRRYLMGLWLSGLRLRESLTLSWDADATFSVDLTGRHPRFKILGESEKGNTDRLLPITPDFAEFLAETPERNRTGLVFHLPGARPRTNQLGESKAGRIVSAIGKGANVQTGAKNAQGEAKHASAHDLRRAFGTRWAARVMPATLQLLMRHKSIDTTLKYYVGLEADDIGDQLRRVDDELINSWRRMHAPGGALGGANESQ